MNKKTLFKSLIIPLIAFSSLGLAEESKSINAMLLTGGGYHDYEKQKTILSEGLGERVNIKWTIIHKEADATKELLSTKGWADGFDVVVYNICHANETDGDYIGKLTDSHVGVPAVIIHCTLHSYHWKTDNKAWTNFIGVTSLRHGAQAPIVVKTVANDHPIMNGLPAEWKTPNGELYHIEKVADTATVLADGSIDNWATKHAVIWVNDFKKTRVFGTSIGHHNETMADKNYLDMVARGLLWSTGHLGEDGKPDAAYVVTK